MIKIEGMLTPPKGKNKQWGVELPLVGVHTQGTSKKNAMDMAADAVVQLVNKPGFVASSEPKEEPSTFYVTSDDVAAFMSFIISRVRTEKKLTARGAASALKSKSPNAYARYETGKTVPRLDTLNEILTAIDPKISVVLKVG